MVIPPGETVATSPLLETKLYIPRWRSGLVSRSRLLECLDQATDSKLTLLSAPAGFGKTTLLAEWLDAGAPGGRPAAWVSLGQSENDQTLFWTYVITALRKVDERVGESMLSGLQSPQPPPIEPLLGTLLNEISTLAETFVLVLDDYHLIDSQPIHEDVAFLLEHLPPQMHLIITGRADPPLPLSRLRGHAELVELRAADLRFTADEASAFLNEVMGLDLSAADVAALDARTEGWIAGLQLAALSMQGRDDIAGFIVAFTGNDRYIVDYLVDEVLRRQPERVRSFLLDTSILERLSGPLCDAVTGQEGGKGVLETLERANLFVVPLDDQRRWYRYHHLFADVLRAHSMEEQPDRVPVLHQRASEWHEQNGQRSDAIRHALAADDFDRAADLVELAWRAMEQRRRSARWLEWAKALPEELVRRRPVLSAAYAWALLSEGGLEAAEAWLVHAEGWLESTGDISEAAESLSVEMIVVDEDEYRSLPATISAARAYHAQALGDLSGSVIHAQRALDFLAEEDHLRRGTPAALLGMASWAGGDLQAADRFLTDAMTSMRLAGDPQFVVTGTYVLSDIRRTRGRLRGAFSACEQALQLATEQEPTLRGTADLHTGLGELYLEQNDLEAATQHLLKSKELGERAALPHWYYRWCRAEARLRTAEADFDGALRLLDEAEHSYVRGPVPEVRPTAALKARNWVARGRLDEALGWAREQGLSVDEDLTYLREFEHITLARVLIAQCQEGPADCSIEEAVTLLDRLLIAADAVDRTGSVIEILALQALAHQAQGASSEALVSLKRALTLGEPEGYVSVFVQEGSAMRDLLRRVTADGTSGSYARRLLSAFADREREAPAPAGIAGSELIEPLTPREIEILRLVAEGMRNQEIADHLVISLATVKRHIANVYGKLDVGHRTEAVAKANELSLL